jgi:hypothetical protein
MNGFQINYTISSAEKEIQFIEFKFELLKLNEKCFYTKKLKNESSLRDVLS